MGASKKIVHLDKRNRLLLGDWARSEIYICDLQPDGTIIATPGEFTPIAASLKVAAAAEQVKREGIAKRAAARRRPAKKAAPAVAEKPQEEK